MSPLTPQQAAAVTGRGNLLVVAGAGTGKTHTLIARCLRLLVDERISLESILLVTFTEAAAAEMRGRLRKELQALHAAEPENEHFAEQLALLETVRISTLHSFCLELIREHFHDLGLDPQFVVLDEQQTRPLQREALDELLERHCTSTKAESLAVRTLIRSSGRANDKRIRKFILQIHAYAQSLPDPEGWLAEQAARFETPAPDEWRKWFVQAVGAWRDEWKTEVAQGAGATVALSLSQAALEALPAEPTLVQCARTLRALVAADGDPHWPRGTKGKFRDPLAAFFDDAAFLKELAPDEKCDPLQQDWDWVRPQMQALIGLVREFTVAFASKKREQGGVDFPDLEQSALRLLRDPAIATEWRTRLAHVFVDEYQDINAAQDAILTALSREAPVANRFLVGDVKQSIYRFRLANPAIFVSYSARWSTAKAEGTRLALTENFRSREGLLRFVNPLFGALMRKEIGGVEYEPLIFGAPEKRAELLALRRPTACVEFHLIAQAEVESASEGEEADGVVGREQEAPDLLAVEREARLVARRLRELHGARHVIWDKEADSFRPVQWSDMAVLLRSPAGRAEAFAKEFSKAGVPLNAARDGFFSSLEISDLLNLLKLLDNPLQDVPLLAVLRSPLVGMSLAELAEVRADNQLKPFWTALKHAAKDEGRVSSRLKMKRDQFLDQFARWRESVRQTSLSQCLESALAETHYEAMLLAGEHGTERTANVRRLLDLTRQFDPYQRQGLYRFLRFVRMQEDEELDLQPGSVPAENAVRLTSIHKSKGLEYPVVVLAGMGTRFNEQALNESVLLSETMGLCPKITPPEAEQSYPGLTHWLARRRERRELRGEELRLAYVACTRARDHLILVGTTKRKAGDVRGEWARSDPISTREITDARSQLDWLVMWLARTTAEESWIDDRKGANDQIGWQIHDAQGTVFGDEKTQGLTESIEAVRPEQAPAGAWEQLQSRLNWHYPFPATTTETAKTSVTALRKRAKADSDSEAANWSPVSLVFRPESSVPGSGHTWQPQTDGLAAAAAGVAHHTFLEHVELERTGSEKELRADAERLQKAGVLSAEQLAGLDFAALANFWQSALGRRICLVTEQVKRELGFTARFEVSELKALLGLRTESPASPSPAEFVVVQGVADLVVLLPKEIWLVDFKTDKVALAGLGAKTSSYEPQLRLYALALGKIYARPVAECHLHFLAVSRTVRIQAPEPIMPA